MWVFRVPESRHASVRRGGGWGAVCDAGDNDAGDGVADPGGAGPAGQALREGEDVDTVGEGEGPWSSPRTGDTDEGGDVAEDGARGAEACGRIGCRRSPRIRVQEDLDAIDKWLSPGSSAHRAYTTFSPFSSISVACTSSISIMRRWASNSSSAASSPSAISAANC